MIGIPLSGLGTWYGFTFNYLCIMSLISHWRAAWGDPGVIPKGMVSSESYSDDDHSFNAITKLTTATSWANGPSSCQNMQEM